MNQIIKPITSPVKTTISLSGSKSITNRALILAALADGQSVLSNMLFSDDTNACLNALDALGIDLKVDRANQTVVVSGCSGVFPNQKASINCHDAGTVTRFLLPVCAAMKDASYYFYASKRMSERPITKLIEALMTQGAQFQFEKETGQMPLTLNANQMIGGNIQIASHQSSQFLSGLLMASPLAKNDMTLITEAKKKLNYVDMTTAMMKSFGVDVNRIDNGHYQIKANQNYVGCDYVIEPDVSTASYFAAVAAISHGEVTINHINKDSLQGDLQFFKVLEKMGCDVIYHQNSITVIGPEKLKGIEVNMATFSDTFMTLAVIASFADSKTHISGISHTRLQESDRIDAISSELRKLGAKVETTEDSITIFPIALHRGIVSGCNDHRIAMSLSLVGLKVNGVEITDSHCVSKTCPDYFERLDQLTK
ncbi:3-phosphoshikimate 1-carboxyvinyltransferase [Thiotrichales bacterium 19S9-12]|nr:3-phosphoshikimate 1-carboxyvinyltransferase [Thiotrichales bacterium 19S9-11]MCF6811563.1 3-phosphoshikimate 1-carboxyvinyltransferase [Thiotrichales bacterium 19S9-12]